MDGSTVGTRYWHRTGDGRVQCDVCPRACRLHEGQRGFCFVRMRQDDAIVLTTYGRSSGYCVDPVEKKPLNHFLPGSAVLSFGTAGCNLGCRFCQNWDISKSRETDTLADAGGTPGHRPGRGPARMPQRRVHLQRPGHLPGVRHRRGRRMPPGGHQGGGGDGRVHVRRAASGGARSGRSGAPRCPRGRRSRGSGRRRPWLAAAARHGHEAGLPWRHARELGGGTHLITAPGRSRPSRHPE